MKIDLTNYKRRGKVALGDRIKILFVNKDNAKDRKVLELNNVAGFLDVYEERETLKWLRIDDNAGVYGEDLSMRLKSPEVAAFRELFLFKDSQCINFNFRAVAEKVEFRDWKENDNWLN